MERLLCSCYARGCRPAPQRQESLIELTAASLWDEVCERLRGALNDTTFQTWFAESEGLELDGDTFAIRVPNDFTREWIEGHFLGLIAAAVKDSIGGERHVRLLVAESEPATLTVAAAGDPAVAAVAPDAGAMAPRPDSATLST
ncbi:MAG: chromosomal replication initiator protein, partial [Gaiellaceae bacterium]|nr:chromosomal replication initiator protein [Gaiellaceae bacterium]